MSFLKKLPFFSRGGDEEIVRLVDQFVAAPSWEESQRLVERYPALLTQPALDELYRLLELARRRRDAQAQALFEEHLALLLRCGEIGVPAAFREKTSAGPSQSAAETAAPTVRHVAAPTLPAWETASQPEIDQAAAPTVRIERPQPTQAPAEAPLEVATAEAALEQGFPAGVTAQAEVAGAEVTRAVEPSETQVDEETVAAAQAAVTRRVEREQQRLIETQPPPPSAADQSAWDRRLEELRRRVESLDSRRQVQEWAAAQRALSAALVQYARSLPAGSQSSQALEEAIVAAYQALEAYHPRRQPLDWAGVHHSLGALLTARQAGARLENLEQAEHHFRQALKVFDSRNQPERWAAVQFDLGRALAQMAPLAVRNRRLQLLDQAIEHLVLALEVYTREAYPQQWAQIQEDLAEISLSQSAYGAGNLVQRAIQFYYLALQVYSREETPDRWAAVNARLAELLCERTNQDAPAEVIEQAIQHALKALQVYTRQSHPTAWADTHRCLGEAFGKRRLGERQQNLERAAHHVQRAMEIYTRQAHPEIWARLQEMLDNLTLPSVGS